MAKTQRTCTASILETNEAELIKLHGSILQDACKLTSHIVVSDCGADLQKTRTSSNNNNPDNYNNNNNNGSSSYNKGKLNQFLSRSRNESSSKGDTNTQDAQQILERPANMSITFSNSQSIEQDGQLTQQQQQQQQQQQYSNAHQQQSKRDMNLSATSPMQTSQPSPYKSMKTSKKMQSKQKMILLKQQKMMEAIQKKNEELHLSSQEGAGVVAMSAGSADPHLSANVPQRSSRNSKYFNPAFMQTIKQKIMEVEKEEQQNSVTSRLSNGLRSCNNKLMNFMLHSYVEIAMGIATIFSLYSEDIRQVAVGEDGDIHFHIVQLVVLLSFIAEIIIFSFGKANYFFRFNFWMDLVSTASMFFDITFLTQGLFGFTVDTNSVSVLKASKVSRIASRATKIVRFVRLLRLSKLQMLYKKAYETLNEKYIAKEEGEEDEQQQQQYQPDEIHKQKTLNNFYQSNGSLLSDHQNSNGINYPIQSSMIDEQADHRLRSSINRNSNYLSSSYQDTPLIPFRQRVNSIGQMVTIHNTKTSIKHKSNINNQNNNATASSTIRDFFRRRSFETPNRGDSDRSIQKIADSNHNQYNYSKIISGSSNNNNNGTSNNYLMLDFSSATGSGQIINNIPTPSKHSTHRKSLLSHLFNSQNANNNTHEQPHNLALLPLLIQQDSIKTNPAPQTPTGLNQKKYSQQSNLSQHYNSKYAHGHHQPKPSVFLNPGQKAATSDACSFAGVSHNSLLSADTFAFEEKKTQMKGRSHKSQQQQHSENEPSYCSNSSQTQFENNNSVTTARNIKQKRETEDSKIGQQLASITINRVIVMVFSLLVCIPFFDETNYIGQDISFDSSLNTLQDLYDSGSDLYSLELKYAISEGRKYDSSDPNYRYPLLKLTMANTIVFPTVSLPYDPRSFTDLRDDEILIFSYNSVVDSSLVFEAQYVIKLDQDLTAYLSICQTTFIIVILAYSTVSFAKDIHKIVVSPIERMLVNIKEIADNPLQAAKMSEEKAMAEQELKKNRVQYMELSEQKGDETYLLESTIMKIGALLAIGFGEAGSKIITKNMRVGGRIDPMIPGKKMMAIFGFCSIKNFADATEILQEKVMIFANEIAELVHICCDSFHGAINKNLGDCFLLVWRFTEDQSQLFVNGSDDSVQLANQPLVQNLSDLPVIAFLKAIGNARMLSLQPAFIKVMPSFKLRLGFGLHVGWGIEGAIGSHFKIDASYLSPNVNMASRLENATKQYGLYFLISGALYRLLSPNTQHAMRHIDRVTVKGSKQPMDLYTCDVNPLLIKQYKQQQKIGNQAASAADDKSENSQDVNKKVLKFISRKRRTERYRKIINGSAQISQILENDPDISAMRQHYTEDFRDTYHDALQDYFEGSWETAKNSFKEAQSILNENMTRSGEDPINDGPSQTLLEYMAGFNFKAPRDWFGYRVLVDK